MRELLELNSDSDYLDNNWPERCIYWNNKHRSEIPKRKRREKQKRGLILTGQPITISVDKSRLVIRDGHTHYPQKAAEYAFFKGELDIPPRIVLVDGKGSISLDALDWMQDQKVDLIRLRYDGHVQSVTSASGYAADPTKVEWQRRTRDDEAARVQYAVKLIKAKVEASLYNLENLIPDNASKPKALLTARNAIETLETNPPETVSKLYAIEGKVALGYFYCWRALEMTWRGLNQHPIPKEWEAFFARSSLKWSDDRVRNQRATHPINAMLNYAYGWLESQTRISAIADGYDPTIGIMHDNQKSDRHGYIFDQMEPHRPIVDRTILKLITEETFHASDFELQSDGVVRLNPELARRLVGAITAKPFDH